MIPMRMGVFLLLSLCVAGSGMGREVVMRARTPVDIPDIPGYLTLKCDFHIHTVFSDGLVWPTVRAEEAWREGLDAIAITDHIEYQPHKADLPVNHQRAFELARPYGDALDLIVIRGSEITRKMPPGHLNAIFLTNSAALDVEAWRDALAEAKRQGAFVFWNHPGWSAQLQGDGVVRWYPEHTELLQSGLLDGIEVANSREVYPEALDWALGKSLTMLSNSDIHNPLNLDYHVHDSDHRPMTLVFATERSEKGIREALFARRTAVYADERLLGEREFLEPIFNASVRVVNPKIILAGDREVYLRVHNQSEVPFYLERVREVEGVRLPAQMTLPPHRTVLAPVKSVAKGRDEAVKIGAPYRVANLLAGPGAALEVAINLEIVFRPE